MALATLAGAPVASKKQSRFELRAEQAWLDRLEVQASRFGLTVASYIRQAVQIKLEADEASAASSVEEEPEKPKGSRPRK